MALTSRASSACWYLLQHLLLLLAFLGHSDGFLVDRNLTNASRVIAATHSPRVSPIFETHLVPPSRRGHLPTPKTAREAPSASQCLHASADAHSQQAVATEAIKQVTTEGPKEGSSISRRFGAAPLAARVTKEAEGAAAAAAEAATATAAGKNVALLAAPRGFCEGVSRAVKTVEEALRVYGRPVYVKHQIVHNEFVCRQLEARGAVFVEDIEEVPPNSVVVFSAHGVSPEVRKAAECRNLLTIDATCPLVQKVHVYVQQKAKEGFQIVIIGHKNHVEVQGVQGEAPGAVQVVESETDVSSLSYPPHTKLFYVTQTTLSLLDCMRIEQALKSKYPDIKTIPSGSVCYATTNRQAAIGALSSHAQLALVVGSSSSSNAKRLVEVAKNKGIPAHLVPSPDVIDPKWLEGVTRVVVSASASTPEALTTQVMQRLADLGVEVQSEALAVNETKPTWKLPKNLRDAAKLRNEASLGLHQQPADRISSPLNLREDAVD